MKEISIAAQGNMRRVLMICNLLIDKGAKLRYPLLTPVALKKMLPEIFVDQ
jgi:hypothetical protein